ncbi:MAG: BON domain-containing protein [Pseudomonas sp.]|uniref:BON domain-containing protein n=1 Tax=Halopseudomonas laoshanensis TaxID=2268758 RepID=UPI001B52EE52|nr:BON domain-containing protein [Pseudomonas sp.]MBQ0777605.1 BON domain-containing protein [Pseudomonas sp.]
MKRLGILIVTTMMLAGCSSVLTAARDTPLEGNQGTRTIGSTIDDQLIETRASVNIAKAHLDLERSSRVSVTSYNGVVLLAGQVPRQELKDLAGNVAKQVQRVKVVHNELTVGENLALLARNNDALITTSVKARMLGDSTIPGRRIKVTTEAGIVYLQGLVSRSEADLAVNAVQQVGGVQRIVKLFEYID